MPSPGTRPGVEGRVSETPATSLAPDANAGKLALVTGGGTGIGLRDARAPSPAPGRRSRSAVAGAEPLEEVRAELEAAGAECLAVPCDIREPDQVAAHAWTVLERFAPWTRSSTTPAASSPRAAEEISAKGWRAVHRLTVDAAWDLTRDGRRRAR